MSGYGEAFGQGGSEAPVAAETVETPAAVSEAAPIAQAEAPQAAPVTDAPPADAPVVSAPSSQTEPQSERDRDIAGLIRALQDERDQKKAAREEAAQLRAWRAEQERKRQEAAAQAPDILEDPHGYMDFAERRQENVVRREVARVQQAQLKQIETLSRAMMVRHIGAEKVAEIEEFSRSAPPKAVDAAYASGDPYGWMFEKFEEAQAHKRAQEAAKQLDGRSIDDIVAERLAAERAKWEVEHGGGQPQTDSQPARPAPPQGPDGKFISPSNQTQRHQPPSLNAVNGAASPRGGEVRSGYDAAFRKG